MSNIAKLKKKAAEFEAKRQPDKALATYIELIAEYEANPDEMDVALYNRVGDFLLKQGNVADAVDYYERAVDHYSEGGFFNNAIALCNKILRQSPARTTVYYKLGKISAQKGFTAEAKRNFLEFADRMQKAGKLDEAFRALKEFADLCPDQDDIRLMLADQLQKTGKSGEAVKQLQLLYQRYIAEGRKSEAEATAERIRSIDPTAEVRAGDTPLETKAQDLVFLDLDEAPRLSRSSTMQPIVEPPPPPPTPPPVASILPPPVVLDLDVPSPAIERTSLAGAVVPEDLEASPLDGVTRATDFAGEPLTAADESAPLAGLQATSFNPRTTGEIPASLVDLEPTSLGEPEQEPEPERATDPDSATELGGDDLLILEPGPVDRPAVEDDDDAVPDGGSLVLILPDDAAPTTSRPTPSDSSPAAGLPLIEFDQDEDSLSPVDEAGDATPVPTPERNAQVGRSSTILAAHSVEMLHAVVEGEPADWDAHRELGEAMLEAGDREGGLQEFETAMKGYENDGNLDSAASMADEIVRADPTSVKHYQKRVEYAFRSNDKHRLVEAYLELADSLFRAEQPDKARVIYHRVLELSPDNLRAQAAISALPEEAPEPPPAAAMAAAPRMTRPITPSDASFINLGDLMRDEEPLKDTRMVVAEQEPTGDEQADFADMLKKFKQGVAENVEEEDYQSHYDLGVAFKEMGLLDEAISEFQKALRGADNRVRTYESIGQCFMEKEQYQMAATLLGRGLNEKGMSDDKLVGVLYLLGRSCEALGKPADALAYYQRIFVVDIRFRDIGERMNAIEREAK